MDFSEIIQFTAFLIGSVAILIGCLAIIFPKKMSQGFGVEVTRPALAYVIALGIRDIFIGATVLTMYFNKEWASLSIISFLIASVALSDFLVVFKNGDKKTSFVHLAGAFAAALYGAALILS